MILGKGVLWIIDLFGFFQVSGDKEGWRCRWISKIKFWGKEELVSKVPGRMWTESHAAWSLFDCSGPTGRRWDSSGKTSVSSVHKENQITSSNDIYLSGYMVTLQVWPDCLKNLLQFRGSSSGSSAAATKTLPNDQWKSCRKGKYV